MIRPRAGTLPFAVLVAIVEYPGQLDAEDIAADLCPPPRFVPPPASMPVAARLRALREHEIRREGLHLAATRRVAVAIGRLVEAGLVAPRRGPTLAPEFLACEERRGRLRALEFFALDHGGKVQDRHLVMVARVVEFCPTTREALLGKSPGRAEQQAYRDLCAWGALVPPSFRVATEAGVALVASTHAQGAA